MLPHFCRCCRRPFAIDQTDNANATQRAACGLDSLSRRMLNVRFEMRTWTAEVRQAINDY
jgi:hypothetical protein